MDGYQCNPSLFRMLHVVFCLLVQHAITLDSVLRGFSVLMRTIEMPTEIMST